MLWFVTYISGCEPERPPTQCLEDLLTAATSGGRFPSSRASKCFKVPRLAAQLVSLPYVMY